MTRESQPPHSISGLAKPQQELMQILAHVPWNSGANGGSGGAGGGGGGSVGGGDGGGGIRRSRPQYRYAPQPDLHECGMLPHAVDVPKKQGMYAAQESAPDVQFAGMAEQLS